MNDIGPTCGHQAPARIRVPCTRHRGSESEAFPPFSMTDPRLQSVDSMGLTPMHGAEPDSLIALLDGPSPHR